MSVYKKCKTTRPLSKVRIQLKTWKRTNAPALFGRLLTGPDCRRPLCSYLHCSNGLLLFSERTKSSGFTTITLQSVCASVPACVFVRLGERGRNCVWLSVNALADFCRSHQGKQVCFVKAWSSQNSFQTDLIFTFLPRLSPSDVSAAEELTGLKCGDIL